MRLCRVYHEAGTPKPSGSSTLVPMRTAALVALSGSILTLWSCKGPGRAATKPDPAPQSGLQISQVRTADRWSEHRLIRGFYPPTDGWRWTARTFALALDPPPPFDAPTSLYVDLTAPHELIGAAGPVTLTIGMNGRVATRKRLDKTGRYQFYTPLELSGPNAGPLVFEFELDGSFHDGANERGIILMEAALTHPEGTELSRDDALEAARRGYLQLLEQRKAALPAATQQEWMKLFHDIPVWRHMWFHNVPIAKNPLDLWMMQQVIYETQPEFIVETGTFQGGSALYWAHSLNGAGLENSRVITVDIQDLTATAARHPLWKKYVSFLKGSSTSPEIVQQIARTVAGRRTLVTLDSDHTGAHVLAELKAYSPLVSKGSYLIVEDTHMDATPTQPNFGRGPYWAVQEFLAGGAEFEQDIGREAYILTFNPGGWLRKK